MQVSGWDIYGTGCLIRVFTEMCAGVCMELVSECCVCVVCVDSVRSLRGCHMV